MANKLKVKKGDTVIVISGRDKGKKGEILRVDTDTRRIVVQGVNMVKRHTRASAAGPAGINEKESSIHVSNVALLDPKTNKPTRVGFKFIEGDRKVRFAKRSGEVIDR